MSDPLTYNRYRTAKVLMALHPELTEETADAKIDELIQSGDLKCERNCSWIINRDSLQRYEHKIYRDSEEVRKRIVNEILEAIGRLTEKVDRLTAKVDKLREDLPEKVKDEVEKLQDEEGKRVAIGG